MDRGRITSFILGYSDNGYTQWAILRSVFWSCEGEVYGPTAVPGYRRQLCNVLSAEGSGAERYLYKYWGSDVLEDRLKKDERHFK